MDYMTKTNNFKQIMNEIVNPENNKDKREVIDALFDNVKRNYEEYKDVVPYIPVYYEPYEYHILQPIAGRYSLLDFLINRAVSNLEKINLENRGSNSHSNNLEININLNRYDKLASKKSSEIVKSHYKKSKYHETLHALHSKFKNENGYFFSNDDLYFRKKVNYFYDKLWKKYTNILHPNQIKNAKCNRRGTDAFQPFQIKGWSGATLGLDEFATEMEAIINSDLLHSEPDVKYIGNNCWQCLPNFDNGYAPFQVFMLQFKSLVNLGDYFMSVFFHTSLAVEKFAFYYSDEILSNSGKYNIDNNALQTFCNLFKDAIVAVQYNGNSLYNVYETLSKIFIQIFANKLKNIKYIDDETLELYKKTFAISYNQAPFKIVDGKAEKTWIGETYWDFYNRVCKELENRNTNEKNAKL